jgi:hypothetical protein
MSENTGKRLLQVVKGWKEGGQVLSTGMRVWIDKRRANIMIRTGYAVEVSADMPYEFPAPKDHPEFTFKKIDFEDEAPKPKAETKGVADSKPKPVVAKNATTQPKSIDVKNDAPFNTSANTTLTTSTDIPSGVPALSDFVANYIIKSLKKSGIETLTDLKGWTIEKLCTIDKVNRQAAEKLIDAYAKFIVYEGKSITFDKMLNVEDKIRREKDELENDKLGDAGLGRQVDKEEKGEDGGEESGFSFD